MAHINSYLNKNLNSLQLPYRHNRSTEDAIVVVDREQFWDQDFVSSPVKEPLVEPVLMGPVGKSPVKPALVKSSPAKKLPVQVVPVEASPVKSVTEGPYRTHAGQVCRPNPRYKDYVQRQSLDSN